MARQHLPTRASEDSTHPFFQSLQKEMNSMMERFRGTEPSFIGDVFRRDGIAMFPAIDVADSDDAVEITAEVPGVKESDLDVSIADDVLIMKGEKSSDLEEKEKDYYVVERRFGSFRRQIPLGFIPEDDAVTVNFADGVLKLHIAKPAKTKAAVRKIDIGKS